MSVVSASAPSHDRLDKTNGARAALAIFLGTRLAYVGLAFAGGLVGDPLGPSPSTPFARAFPALASLGRDATWASPPFDHAARALGATATGSLAWLLLSQIASAVAFLVIHRVIEERADHATATWTLAFIAASPFAFVIAQAGPLPFAVCASAGAAWAATRGRSALAAVIASLGVLAHPMAAGIAPLIVASAPRASRSSTHGRLWAGLPLALGAVAWWQAPHASPLVTTAPVLAAAVPFAALVVIGVMALALRAPDRAWLPSAALTLVMLVTTGGAPLGRTLAACWPAFVPAGARLARAPAAAVTTVALLSLWQGLLYYLHTHGAPWL